MTALNILIYPGDHLKVITFLFIKNTYIRMYYLRSRHFHKLWGSSNRKNVGPKMGIFLLKFSFLS